MKKVLLIAVMAIFAAQLLPARDVVTKDEQRLPQKARTFIQENFADTGISYIKIDSEFFKGKKYEVLLTNGTEIEFDNKGNWNEVDTKRSAIPASLIPVYISDYVKANFNNEFITKIEKDWRGLEVELNNDLSLRFNKKGDLFEIDD